ncbi:prenylated flavin chaperone LpdD [Levilactobacillus acidifarinae]|uniref:Prenylated flavin chaperone LpdD-like domain-containing protein n=1 Tax=Levilactobacillus acidifarinae DSM 19394 = JCM 15949 TaxID=1423715 RepID=A0A0R1LHL8_9LACO|nr:hypothetical protein [Levilactobacillus acidifarinae]KRK95406.1 hypothetical protein FD25_GL001526 [Levilactobacillus acidifarinae DSM 19394]GEO70001.1 amino acid decarboxylase [Levilactobacillus acidifarinae]
MPQFQVTQVGYTMTAELTVVGPDLLIVVTGGTHPHIGDVTTLTRTTPLRTVKFPSHDGRYHKDHLVGERVAHQVQPTLTGSCTVTAGIHVDQITQAQIEASGKMGDDLGRQIVAWLRTHPVTAPSPVYYRDGQQPPQV